MNDNFSNQESETTDTIRKVSTIWMILLPLFALLALYQFYNWTQGRDYLRNLISPIGFIFLGLSTLLRPRIAVLANAMLVVAIILVIAQLMLVATGA